MAGVAFAVLLSRLAVAIPAIGDSRGSHRMLAARLNSLDAGADGPACDSDWCDCGACAKGRDNAPCDLCDRKWVFVIAVGGRTGSTSILQALNALPGVSMTGENNAILEDLRHSFSKVVSLVKRNKKAGGASAYYMPRTQGVERKALCAQQSFMAALSGEDTSVSNGTAPILGFKELIDTSVKSEGQHFSSSDLDWIKFFDVLFPCSRTVFNLRRDTAAQARSIRESFSFTSMDDQEDNGPGAGELDRMSKIVLEWHANRTRKGSRSFLMHTEDFSAGKFTELAEWLGIPCSFGTVPHANDPDDARPGQNPSFHLSSEPVKVACTTHKRRSAGRQLLYTTEGLKQLPERASEPDDEACGSLSNLPHNQACIPSDGALHEGVDTPALRGPADLNALPKFYLHEEGVFDFSDSVSCLFRAFGMEEGADEFDLHASPDVASHTADYWLLQRFRQHPARVHDPAEAQLHVIGTPFATAFRAHRGMRWDMKRDNAHQGGHKGGCLGCGTMESFYKRTAAVSAYLNSSVHFQRHGGRNWLLLNSFYWPRDSLGDDLMYTLLSGPSILTTADNRFRDFKWMHNKTGLVTTIPYKADHRLDQTSHDQSILSNDRHTIMFHGTVERGTDNGYEEGSLRQRICDVLQPAIANHSLQCVSKWAGGSHTALLALPGQVYVKGDDRTWMGHQGPPSASATLEAYTESQVCLVPAGDTPTSRRLFDAMAAGCLPILMLPQGDILPNLPFQRTIDWRKTVLFGGSISCALNQANSAATVDWIQSLLHPSNAEKLSCMRREARRVFREHLSYQGLGAVTALLGELQRDERFAEVLSRK